MLKLLACRRFGRPRLLPALPLIVADFMVPLMFHPDRDICTNVVATLITMWMTSFKVRGPRGQGSTTKGWACWKQSREASGRALRAAQAAEGGVPLGRVHHLLSLH